MSTHVVKEWPGRTDSIFFFLGGMQSLRRMSFSLPPSEWQSLPGRGILLDHTLPHRLPLQTAKGKQVTYTHSHTDTHHAFEQSSSMTLSGMWLLPLHSKKKKKTSVSFLSFHTPPPFLVSLSTRRLHLPQESTTQISTATAAFVLTSCDHSGLRLSPSPKVGCLFWPSHTLAKKNVKTLVMRGDVFFLCYSFKQLKLPD